MTPQIPYRNFYQAITQNANNSSSRAIVFEDKLCLSNKKFLEYVDTVASFLHKNGVKPGNKIALVMSNCWQFTANIFAISKLGAVVVPVNNFFKEDEIAYVLNDSQAIMLFSSAKFASETHEMSVKSNVRKIIWVDGLPFENEHNIDYAKIIANPQNTAPFFDSLIDDLAIIVYTSGTTGKPKGAMLSYKNVFSNIYCSVERMHFKPEKARMICYLPMFHAFSLTVTVLLPIITNSGVTIVRSIATKGDFAKLLKLVLLRRIPFFCGVPDVYSALAKAKLPWYFHWFHSVKGFVSGAAPLSEETMRRFSATFKRGMLVQGYGISECSPIVSANMPWANRNGSVGQPLIGYQVATFDEEMNQLPSGEIGELCVKGDCVMLGYFNRPEETSEAIVDGWFKTGDIGKVDEDGYIFILDRKKDLIISKGMNIYPRELEEIIYTNGKVNACAVIGIKDNESNETPVAYIELKEGESATELELKAFVKPHLAPYKQPKKFYFIEKLPRNATGKILKRELRELSKSE